MEYRPGPLTTIAVALCVDNVAAESHECGFHDASHRCPAGRRARRTWNAYHGSHTMGAPDGVPGLSGTGWSTEHGDLRIPHFIGLHALQVLPLIAFVTRRRRLSSDTRVRLTLTAAGSSFTLVVLLLAQALRGQPLLRPDAITFGLLGAWAPVTAICGWKSVNLASAATAPGTI